MMEFQPATDANGELANDRFLMRVAPELYAKVAKTLGHAPDDPNVPGGFAQGLWPRAIERVAAMNPHPAGPEAEIYPTVIGRMRRALGKPLADNTPAPQLVREIFEKLLGERLMMTPASGAETARMAMSAAGDCVLALSADARFDAKPDRQFELMREQTRLRTGAPVFVLSADATAALALSGDRQAQLLREQISEDEPLRDDRQMKLLLKQLA